VRGLHLGDRPAEIAAEHAAHVAGLRGADAIAGLARLPLRPHFGDVAHVDAERALEPVVAVEAGAILAELHQPPPHFVGRRLNRHRVLQLQRRVARHLIARQRHRQLGGGRAPVAMHRPQHQRAGDVEQVGRRHGDGGAMAPAAMCRTDRQPAIDAGEPDEQQHDVKCRTPPQVAGAECEQRHQRVGGCEHQRRPYH
jgi:hypothetical protein